MHKHKTVSIPVLQIKVDKDLNIRERIDMDIVAQYAEILDQMPPVSVINTGDGVYLVDGFHRYYARLYKGQDNIICDIYEGQWDTAIELAVSLNCSHGRPFSQKERLTAARRIIALHPDWTDNKISRAVGCSHNTVTRLRNEPDPQAIPHPEKLSNDNVPQVPDFTESKHLKRILSFPDQDTAKFFDDTIELAKKVTGSEKIVACVLAMCAEFRATYENPW